MQIAKLNIHELSDILEVSDISESIDLGATVIHKALHPMHGTIAVIASLSGDGVLVSKVS